MAENYANIMTAGFSAWKLRASDFARYYKILDIRDGMFRADAQTISNSRGMNRANQLVRVEISGKCMITNVAHIEKLVLPSLQINHKLELTNGKTFDSALIAGGATEGWFGYKGRFSSEEDVEGNRYIEIIATRTMEMADFEACFGTPTADGTPDAGDYLYFLSQATLADIHGNGVKNVEIKDAAAYDSLRHFTDAKYVAEAVEPRRPDNLGRMTCKTIRLSAEVNRRQSSTTEINALDTEAVRQNDWKVTLLGNVVVEMLDSLGLGWGIMNQADGDDLEHIRYVGTGIINQSAWAGMVA